MQRHGKPTMNACEMVSVERGQGIAVCLETTRDLEGDYAFIQVCEQTSHSQVLMVVLVQGHTYSTCPCVIVDRFAQMAQSGRITAAKACIWNVTLQRDNTLCFWMRLPSCPAYRLIRRCSLLHCSFKLLHLSLPASCCTQQLTSGAGCKQLATPGLGLAVKGQVVHHQQPASSCT